MSVAETTLAVGDLSLRAFSGGDGRPLILLHGIGGLDPVARLVDHLTKRFTVIAPEHPGWGATPAPPYLTTIRDLAELYQELIEQSSEPVTLVGLSCGGWIASEMACSCRHGISALALVSPVGIKIAGANVREFLDIWENDPMTVRNCLYGGADGAPSIASLTDDDFLRIARGLEGTARYCWAPYMHDPKLARRLRRVDVATLLISGAEDGLALLPDYYATYADCFGPGGASHQVVAGVGHVLEEQVPERLGDAILEFVEASVRVSVGSAK